MAEIILRTAQQALELWDAGEFVPAFQVESEGATQEQLWGAAFEALRAGTRPPSSFTKRERDVINSIVAVASQFGKKTFPPTWAAMVSSHVHEKSPAITIRKPAPPDAAYLGDGIIAREVANLAEQKQKEAKTQENEPTAAPPAPGALAGAQSDSADIHVGDAKATDVDNTQVSG